MTDCNLEFFQSSHQAESLVDIAGITMTTGRRTNPLGPDHGPTATADNLGRFLTEPNNKSHILSLRRNVLIEAIPCHIRNIMRSPRTFRPRDDVRLVELQSFGYFLSGSVNMITRSVMV